MFAAEYEPADIDGRRRSPRASVAFDAQLAHDGLARTLCKVIDLSLHGVRLQTYSALKVGMLLWLTLPEVGRCAVRVVRADDYEAGCAFLDPITSTSFDALVARNAH